VAYEPNLTIVFDVNSKGAAVSFRGATPLTGYISNHKLLGENATRAIGNAETRLPPKWHRVWHWRSFHLMLTAQMVARSIQSYVSFLRH
jgi:hypothetical protein